VNGLRETCHCGHDKLTHYLDHDTVPPQRVSCLAMACDCRAYAHEGGPKPVKPPTRPNHPYQCRCSRCREYFEYSQKQVAKIPDFDP
jgi:hypothetical protein